MMHTNERLARSTRSLQVQGTAISISYKARDFPPENNLKDVLHCG